MDFSFRFLFTDFLASCFCLFFLVDWLCSIHLFYLVSKYSFNQNEKEHRSFFKKRLIFIHPCWFTYLDILVYLFFYWLVLVGFSRGFYLLNLVSKDIFSQNKREYTSLWKKNYWLATIFIFIFVYLDSKGLSMENFPNSQVVAWIKSFITDESIIRFFQGTVCFI